MRIIDEKIVAKDIVGEYNRRRKLKEYDIDPSDQWYITNLMQLLVDVVCVMATVDEKIVAKDIVGEYNRRRKLKEYDIDPSDQWYIVNFMQELVDVVCVMATSPCLPTMDQIVHIVEVMIQSLEDEQNDEKQVQQLLDSVCASVVTVEMRRQQQLLADEVKKTLDILCVSVLSIETKRQQENQDAQDIRNVLQMLCDKVVEKMLAKNIEIHENAEKQGYFGFIPVTIDQHQDVRMKECLRIWNSCGCGKHKHIWQTLINIIVFPELTTLDHSYSPTINYSTTAALKNGKSITILPSLEETELEGRYDCDGKPISSRETIRSFSSTNPTSCYTRINDSDEIYRTVKSYLVLEKERKEKERKYRLRKVTKDIEEEKDDFSQQMKAIRSRQNKDKRGNVEMSQEALDELEARVNEKFKYSGDNNDEPENDENSENDEYDEWGVDSPSSSDLDIDDDNINSDTNSE